MSQIGSYRNTTTDLNISKRTHTPPHHTTASYFTSHHHFRFSFRGRDFSVTFPSPVNALTGHYALRGKCYTLVGRGQFLYGLRRWKFERELEKAAGFECNRDVSPTIILGGVLHK